MTLEWRYMWYSEQFASRLERLVTSGQYDGVVGLSGSAALHLKGLAPGNILLDLNDAEEMNYRRAALHAHDLRDRLRGAKNVLAFQLFRRRVLSKYRHLLVVCQTDAQFLRRQLPHAAVHVIPLGVEPSFLEEAIGEESGVLMFHGVLLTGHNHDAAMYLLREIFPKVSESQPNSRLLLVGPGARPSLVDLASRQKNVRLLGYVPDVRPYLRRAAVYLCPHETGSGMKTKLLEAWAMGKATVVSPVAVEGLPLRDGQHALVADSPAGYSRAISRLLADQELRRSIGENARQFVKENFLPDVLSAQLESLLVGLSPQGPATRDTPPQVKASCLGFPRV
jgi:glycosyltransferase involved in cell wall biosynthesis